MRGKADQRLVMAFAPGHIPIRRFDIPGVDRIAQDIGDPLMRQLAGFGLLVERMPFQEADHIGLRLEPRGGVALKRFGDDRRRRFVAHQDLAIQPGDAPKAVAARRAEYGEAVLQTRAHPVQCLLGIVDAVIVGEGDGHVFHQPRRRFPVIDHARRFEARACLGDSAAQIGVEVGVTREAVEVIEHDAVGVLFVRRDEGDQIADTRARAFRAGQRVSEHLHDLIATALRMFAKTRFLRGKAVPIALLFLAGNSAVDNSKLLLACASYCFFLFHLPNSLYIVSKSPFSV